MKFGSSNVQRTLKRKLYQRGGRVKAKLGHQASKTSVDADFENEVAVSPPLSFFTTAPRFSLKFLTYEFQPRSYPRRTQKFHSGE